MIDGEFPDKNIDRTVSEVRRARDFDDLQNELASRETGRISRFLGENSQNAKASQRRKSQQRIELTSLQLLLQNDPVYAAQYEDVMDLLSRAETATEKALVQTEQDLSLAQDEVSDTLNHANKLPDGTAIFKDKDGTVWTENGQLVSEAKLEEVQWKETVPSHEDYVKQRQAVEDLQRYIDALRRYQVDVLGHSRNSLIDPNNPPSTDELKQIEKAIQEKAPNAVRAAHDPQVTEIAPQHAVSTHIEKPVL